MKRKGPQGPWLVTHSRTLMDLPSWSQMLAADNEFGGQDWDKDAVGCACSLGWMGGLGSWRQVFPIPRVGDSRE